MNEILEQLKELDLQIEHIIPVQGGDISDTYRVESFDKKYFLKLITAKNFPGFYEKEVSGLEVIRKSDTAYTPRVIKTGETHNDFQYLILEWLERDEPSYKGWQQLGRQVAQLHKNTNPTFGWREDNYIGIVIQPNNFVKKWTDFYIVSRIEPMVKMLYNKKLLLAKDLKAAERLYKELNSIFPVEVPSLVHGDLWSGNIFPTASDQIALIDPSVYYGHREMDIAMAKLFGGFDEVFFETYHETHPLIENWEDRLPIAQLFPLLIHAYLFEGYYIKDVQAILKKF